MEPASADSSSQPTPPASNTEEQHSTKVSGQPGNAHDSQLSSPTSGISSWARNLKFPQALGLGAQQNSQTENAGMSAFARLTGGLGLQTLSNETAPVKSGTEQSNLLESVTKGLVDSSKSAVKAVQVKARHIVSQNKRRYQVSWVPNFTPGLVLPLLRPHHGINCTTDLCYHVQICWLRHLQLCEVWTHVQYRHGFFLSPVPLE